MLYVNMVMRYEKIDTQIFHKKLLFTQKSLVFNIPFHKVQFSKSALEIYG